MTAIYTGPVRILHVINSLRPVGGGPPIIASRLAAAQAGRDHDVHILSYRWTEDRGELDAVWDGVPWADRVSKHDLPRPSRLEKLTGRAARRAARPLVATADIVHVHSVWGSMLRVSAAEARRRATPYLVLLNGMLDPWSLAQKPLKKRLALRLGYRAMLDGAAALQLGNETERKLIEPLGLRPPGIVIPNGIFLEEIEPLPEPGAFVRGHPELGEAPFILFLSRLHYKKGLDHLADAFIRIAAEDPTTHLVVAGPDGGARASFEAEIVEAGLSSRVHLVGPLYGRDKFAAISDATCWCLPSRQEGFPVAVNEALACGAPMVITEGCHRPDVAEAGAGLVVPLDPQRIADALRRVLDDASLRRSMREAGQRLFRERYTWQRVAEQTIEAYEQIRERRE